MHAISPEAMAVLVAAARDGNAAAAQLLADLDPPEGQDLVVPEVIRQARAARPNSHLLP